ncbi:uncharacterized protein LOC142769036 [Rhipicephalus microplus]|uniref:uncharacterized protein LOC142769036 n=1 Tax=Rhipicephalus microplus TaxID=6941 RepID=UPI003F6CF01B
MKASLLFPSTSSYPALRHNNEVGDLPTTTDSTDVSQRTPPEDRPLVDRLAPLDTSVNMTTSAPTYAMCDTHTGAICNLFTDTTCGTITEPAAVFHTSNKATASLATTVNDAPVMPMTKLPDCDSPATQSRGQHAIAIPRAPVAATIGGDVAIYVACYGQVHSMSPADTDLLQAISGDSTEELETNQHFPLDIRRRSGSDQCCSSPGPFPSAHARDLAGSLPSMYILCSCHQPIAVQRTCPPTCLQPIGNRSVQRRAFLPACRYKDHRPACSFPLLIKTASNSQQRSCLQRSCNTCDTCPHEASSRSAPF